MRNIIWSLAQLCRDAEGFMNLLVSAKLVYTQHQTSQVFGSKRRQNDAKIVQTLLHLQLQKYTQLSMLFNTQMTQWKRASSTNITKWFVKPWRWKSQTPASLRKLAQKYLPHRIWKQQTMNNVSSNWQQVSDKLIWNSCKTWLHIKIARKTQRYEMKSHVIPTWDDKSFQI